MMSKSTWTGATTEASIFQTKEVDQVIRTDTEINDASNVLTVWLIPETLERTNLSTKKSADLVNIEVDVLAKYVERLLAKKDVK